MARTDYAAQLTAPIDGFRAIAALLVLCYHTWLFSWWDIYFGFYFSFGALARVGFLGVDLFFVISAFCLSYKYVENAFGVPQDLRVSHFAWRRICKIVPSYIVVVLAAAFVSRHDLSVPVILQGIATHMAFIQNYSYDAFGEHISVLWSLAVEVQFYLIFPILIKVFLRFPVLTAGLMFAVAWAFRTWSGMCCLASDPIIRALPAYLDLFACGMGAAYITLYLKYRRPAFAALKHFFSGLAFLCIVLALVIFAQANHHFYDPLGKERFAINMRGVLGADLATLMVAVCFSGQPIRRIFANRILWGVSLISYNLYLWHTLIEIWLRDSKVLPARTPTAYSDPHWRPLFILVAVPLSFLIAHLATRYIELPLLYPDWSKVRAFFKPAAAPQKH